MKERGQIAKKIDPGTWWPPFEPPQDSIPGEAEGGNKGVAGADTGGSPNGLQRWIDHLGKGGNA